MAKNNSKIKWMGIGLTALLIIGTVIATFVWAQADIKATDTKAEGIKVSVETLKTEGCKPTIPLRLDVALVKKDIAVMKEDISDMRVEQKAGFKEILSRLPE